jgi:hypothetical protein
LRNHGVRVELAYTEFHWDAEGVEESERIRRQILAIAPMPPKRARETHR